MASADIDGRAAVILSDLHACLAMELGEWAQDLPAPLGQRKEEA